MSDAFAAELGLATCGSDLESPSGRVERLLGSTDEVKPDWDLSGATEDAQLLFQVGYCVAKRTAIPEWKAGTEFKAKRDSVMR